MIRDLVCDRGMMRFNALSPRHVRQFTEHTAAPILRLIESLEQSGPARLHQFRSEFDTLAAQYFEMDSMRQSHLMTRGVKVRAGVPRWRPPHNALWHSALLLVLDVALEGPRKALTG